MNDTSGLLQYERLNWFQVGDVASHILGYLDVLSLEFCCRLNRLLRDSSEEAWKNQVVLRFGKKHLEAIYYTELRAGYRYYFARPDIACLDKSVPLGKSKDLGEEYTKYLPRLKSIWLMEGVAPLTDHYMPCPSPHVSRLPLPWTDFYRLFSGKLTISEIDSIYGQHRNHSEYSSFVREQCIMAVKKNERWRAILYIGLSPFLVWSYDWMAAAVASCWRPEKLLFYGAPFL